MWRYKPVSPVPQSCELSSQSHADPAQSSGAQVPNPVGSRYVIFAARCLSITLPYHSNHSFPWQHPHPPPTSPPPLSTVPPVTVCTCCCCCFPSGDAGSTMDGDVMEYFPCCFSKISKISWSGLYTTPQPSSCYLSCLDARGLLTINAREYIDGESEYLVITSWLGNVLRYIMKWISLTRYWTLTLLLPWCKQIINSSLGLYKLTCYRWSQVSGFVNRQKTAPA